MSRKYREAPDTLDTVELIEFCRDHRAYLQINTQMMGYEVGVVYRIYEQEKSFYSPDIAHSVQRATLQVLNDMAPLGYWIDWNDSCYSLQERLVCSLTKLESQYDNESLPKRLAELVIVPYNTERENQDMEALKLLKKALEDESK